MFSFIKRFKNGAILNQQQDVPISNYALIPQTPSTLEPLSSFIKLANPIILLESEILSESAALQTLAATSRIVAAISLLVRSVVEGAMGCTSLSAAKHLVSAPFSAVSIRPSFSSASQGVYVKTDTV
ncbi:hypothetical protein [Candidatus Vallotia tarda]|uniref:Uncharacterized protein n=1 Tax=Candidatus Vallotiella hemipterorum TaxID=1177213 RepID=A0A916NEC1_9BURK|nr:hypothetical protein [Candidatus Vallotia tarda]CAG7596553.1 hypothetical protein MYVALT_G_01060 [Candidatus Vallotia tarda]